MKKILTGILCFSFLSFCLLAQTANNSLSLKIILKPGKYSLQSLINTISTIKGINLTYNIKSLPIDNIIEIDIENPELKQVLDAIQKQSQVEYVIKNEYIILKAKKKSGKYQITGIVRDSAYKEPMAGTIIYIKGSNSGVTSNENGSYYLSLQPGNYTLVFSFLGYEIKEKNISLYDDLELNVNLKSSTNSIKEVKVTTKRHDYYHLDVGRPIQQIDALEIESQNVNNASDILLARLSGVWATKSSGMPGDHVNIRIRGINSLFGSVDPLYVIDGVSVPIVNLNTLGIADLNIHDIENVTVLKDASSGALYGFQGGNGVIIIDTKQGGKESHLEFTTKFGFEYFNKRYDLMDTKDFLASLDSSQNKFNLGIRQYYPVYSDTQSSENMQNKIFKVGIVKEYQLSGSGNVKNINYFVSGNYYSHTGIIANSDYKRYSVSANAEKKFADRASAEIGYRGSLQKNLDNLDTYGGNNLIFQGINKAPLIKTTPDSMYWYTYKPTFHNLVNRIYLPPYYTSLLGRELTDSLINNKKSLNISSQTFRASGKIKITDDIFINAATSLTLKSSNYLSDIRHSYIFNRFQWTFPDYYLSSTENVVILNSQINMNLHKKIGGHEFNFIAGCKFYKDNIYWNLDSSNNSIENYNTANETYIRGSSLIHGPRGSVIRDINSYLGNVIYNYKQTYFISFAGNYENIKEGLYLNTTAFFPSVAINWDVAHEFNTEMVPWLNHFNLYANWGRSGNYPLNSLSDDLYGQAYQIINSKIDTGYSVRQLGNHGLKPEMVEEHDFGTSIDLFKNSRIIFTSSLYYKTNSNLIIMRDIPAFYDGGQMYDNIGKLETNGLELGLEVVPVLTRHFLWYSKFNFSTNHETIKQLADYSSIDIPSTDLLYPDFTISKNGTLGNIMGYKEIGLWSNADQVAFLKNPQHPQYVNINGYKFLNADASDATISTSDKVALGSSIPAYTWNWYNSFSYKNFGVEMIWYAVMGTSKYNATRAASFATGTNREVNKLISDSSKIFTNPIFYQSSFFVENNSFLRLKELTFSYQPMKKYFNTANMKFSLSFENLVTITPYKGYDPEAAIYTDNTFSDNAIDRGAFPNPQAVYLSITLKF